MMMGRFRWILFLCLPFLLCCSLTYAQNQTLEGQLTAISREIRTFHDKDRLHAGKKLRFVDVLSSNLPNANYDQRIKEILAKRLEGVLDENGKLQLKVEWTYKDSASKTNEGKQVIEIKATISLENGLPIPMKSRVADVTDTESIVREINNSSDIAKIVGTTLSPPDTIDHATRLKAIQASFENPRFSIRDETRITAVDEPRYAVELRKRAGGRSDSVAIPPVDQNGMAFAPVAVGDTYEIILFNYDDQADAVARLEIDGLDVGNAFNRDTAEDGVSMPGYFIPRASNGRPGIHIVSGWLHTIKSSNDNVFQFVVDELGKGAATAKKAKGKTGVVTVQFFEAYSPKEVPRARSFGETGLGKPMKVDYETKPCQISEPASAIVTVRYSR